MSEDTIEDVASQNDTEQGSEETLDVTTDQSVADTEEEGDNVDELKDKLTKTQQQNQKLFERAKKAEGFEKQPDGSWVKVQKKAEAKTVEQSDELNFSDGMALMNAKVTEDEDIAKIRKYAKSEGLSIKDALKDKFIVSYLAQVAEERQTANATNTGPTRRGNSKVPVDVIKSKAQKGEMPEGEDLDRMLEDRYTRKTE